MGQPDIQEPQVPYVHAHAHLSEHPAVLRHHGHEPRFRDPGGEGLRGLMPGHRQREREIRLDRAVAQDGIGHVPGPESGRNSARFLGFQPARLALRLDLDAAVGHHGKVTPRRVRADREERGHDDAAGAGIEGNLVACRQRVIVFHLAVQRDLPYAPGRVDNLHLGDVLAREGQQRVGQGRLEQENLAARVFNPVPDMGAAFQHALGEIHALEQFRLDRRRKHFRLQHYAPVRAQQREGQEPLLADAEFAGIDLAHTFAPERGQAHAALARDDQAAAVLERVHDAHSRRGNRFFKAFFHAGKNQVEVARACHRPGEMHNNPASAVLHLIPVAYILAAEAFHIEPVRNGQAQRENARLCNRHFQLGRKNYALVGHREAAFFLNADFRQNLLGLNHGQDRKLVIAKGPAHGRGRRRVRRGRQVRVEIRDVHGVQAFPGLNRDLDRFRGGHGQSAALPRRVPHLRRANGGLVGQSLARRLGDQGQGQGPAGRILKNRLQCPRDRIEAPCA